MPRSLGFVLPFSSPFFCSCFNFTLLCFAQQIKKIQTDQKKMNWMYHFHQQWITRGFPWFCRKENGNKLHKSYLFSPLTQCLALYPHLDVQLWRGGRWQTPAHSPASRGTGHHLSCKMLLHSLATFSHFLRRRVPFSSHWQGNEKRPQIHCIDTWHLGGCFFHLIWDFKPVPTVHCAALKSAVKAKSFNSKFNSKIHSMAQSAAKAGPDECQTANDWEIPQQPLNPKLQRLQFCLLRCLTVCLCLCVHILKQKDRKHLTEGTLKRIYCAVQNLFCSWRDQMGQQNDRAHPSDRSDDTLHNSVLFQI